MKGQISKLKLILITLTVGILIYGLALGGRGGVYKGEYGLYCWHETDVALAKKAAVSEIYQAYSMEDLREGNTDVSKFNRAGIDVWFLTGDPSWGLDEIIEAIETLAVYNNAADSDSRFAGIQFDTEPCANEDWDQNKWYEALCARKRRAEELDIRMMVCIPRWLDEDLLEKVIRDCCDTVAVMDYDRENEIEDIADEARLAEEYGKGIIYVSELSEPGTYDLTDRNTYYNAGLDELYASWDRMKAVYPDMEFAYHHADPLQKMIEQ